MSKGTYDRKMKRIARMKDPERADRWRSRVEQEFGAGAGTRRRGTGLVQALGSIGEAVRKVGSAVLGRTTSPSAEPDA